MAADEEQSTIEKNLAAFDSPRWPERRDATRWAGDILRGEEGAEFLGELVPRLEKLAGDASSEVRLAVANALPHLRHPSFDKIAARLVDDSNAYVRRAAERAVKQRKQETSVPPAEDGIDTIQRQIDRITRLYSPEVAKEAIALGETYHEVYCAEASHQMLQVLTSLKGSLKRLGDGLRGSAVDRSLVETLAKARSRAEHLEKITEDLKAYATSGQPEFHKENLLSIVKEALDMVREHFKGAKVTEPLSIDDGLVIDAPRRRLVQAFMNILKNGFEAVGSGGAVEVSAVVQAGGEIEIRFTDSGGGIPEESLGDVFRPFSTNKEGHTGYGLALAKKIIARECRGTIEIASREGSSTTVTVRLPIERE